MFTEQYILVPLTTRKDLCSECIELLNQEWPRSVGARENTLRKSLNSVPPMSFIVVDEKTDKLIGHARLCPLLAMSQSCWIESVIISSDLRGKGLGYWLMRKLEVEARKFGFKKAYLSSENKQAFYAKCGYSACEPVLNVGANTALFERFDSGRFFLLGSNESTSNKRIVGSDSLKPSASRTPVFSYGKNLAFSPPPPSPSTSVTSLPSSNVLNFGNSKSHFMLKML